MNALQAYFEGVKATQRPTYIIAFDHMDKLKIIAFVGNAGHFKNETNFAALTVVSRWVQLWSGDHTLVRMRDRLEDLSCIPRLTQRLLF